MRHAIAASLALAVLCVGSPVSGQSSSPNQRGRLLVTVADTTGAVIPDAKVSLVGLEDATRAQGLVADKHAVGLRRKFRAHVG